ncbi:MAG: CoA-binding protein [Deltaproteobacteria bacterium]|nr:CoA-binding protein [Deltaproteobacteria bacterium]
MKSYSFNRMKEFFSPHDIAVVGATANNQWFGNILANAFETGFDGRFYPVNPGADEVHGIKAYRSISALPDDTIELAIVIVKSSIVIDAVRELVEKGIKNVLLVSSGFAEMGHEGKGQQEILRQYCEDNGVVLMGPNCLGFVNASEKVTVFSGRAVEGDLIPGSVAVVGQSGATSEVITTKILKKSLGISLYITTGNEAIVTAEDCLEYLVHDENTSVITGFIEEFRNIEKLKIVAREAAKRKIPLVMLKIGRSAKARKAAVSHTGALAGNDGVIDGFFSQLGIIRVETLEELVETAAIFSLCRLPEGKGLGIYTYSGGMCGIFADLCQDNGIELPSLQDKTKERLKAVLPTFAQPDNPLDVTGSGFLGGLDDIVQAMMDDENIDILASVSVPPQSEDDFLAPVFNESYMPIIHTAKKPIIPITFREMSDYARAYFQEKKVYFIDSHAVGFKALSHLINYAEFLRRFQGEAEAHETKTEEVQ